MTAQSPSSSRHSSRPRPSIEPPTEANVGSHLKQIYESQNSILRGKSIQKLLKKGHDNVHKITIPHRFYEDKPASPSVNVQLPRQIKRPETVQDDYHYSDKVVDNHSNLNVASRTFKELYSNVGPPYQQLSQQEIDDFQESMIDYQNIMNQVGITRWQHDSQELATSEQAKLKLEPEDEAASLANYLDDPPEYDNY